MKFIYSKFKDIIDNNDLIAKGDTIIIALSGGKDSVALTILLKSLQKEIDFDLVAAYFNHKIRTDYKEEEDWVKKFCKTYGIQLFTGGAFVKKYVAQNRLNLENGASILRYKFFNSIIDNYKNVKVFTAHTKSDVTETFLIKLFRGSGLQGLTSISMKKNKLFYRPLLHFTKEQILDFLQRNNINFYTDYSNIDNVFLRNKIRNQLIPIIKKIEPNIDNSIYRTIEIIKEEYNYFTDLAIKILKENIILDKILPLSIISIHHLAIQRHILREYLRSILGNLFNISFKNLENMLNSIKNVQNISLPGVDLSIKKGFMFPTDINLKHYNYLVNNPDKEVIIEEIGKSITLKQIENYLRPDNNHEIIVPKEKCLFPLTIRSPKKEDKYIKINSSFNLTVFEMIRSFNKPPELRNLCPVLANSNGDIIWVFGSPVSEKFKINNKNKKGLFLQIAIHNLKI